MLALFEPSVRPMRGEFETESHFDSQHVFDDPEQLRYWLLSQLRRKPHAVRQEFHHSGRVDLSAPIRLIPIDRDFRLLPEQMAEVDAQELNNSNIVIQHCELLEHPEAVLVMPLRDGRLVPIRTRLTWTRFRGPGCYQSGGRFVVGPLAEPSGR